MSRALKIIESYSQSIESGLDEALVSIDINSLDIDEGLKDILSKAKNAAKGPIAKALVVALLAGAANAAHAGSSVNLDDLAGKDLSKPAATSQVSGGGGSTSHTSINPNIGSDNAHAAMQSRVDSQAGKQAVKILASNGINLDIGTLTRINNELNSGKHLNDPSVKNMILKHVSPDQVQAVSRTLDSLS